MNYLYLGVCYEFMIKTLVSILCSKCITYLVIVTTANFVTSRFCLYLGNLLLQIFNEYIN